MEELIVSLAGFFFVLIGLMFLFYILGSLGLMGIAKQTDTKNGWMAWFPLFSCYLVGKIAFNKAIAWALVVLTFLSGTGSLSLNGDVVSEAILPSPFNDIAQIALAALLIVCLYKIYKKVSDKAIVMTIFSILSCGLLVPIFLFAIRKNPKIV